MNINIEFEIFENTVKEYLIKCFDTKQRFEAYADFTRKTEHFQVRNLERIEAIIRNCIREISINKDGDLYYYNALTTCDWNGYYREESLERLTQHNHNSLILSLIFRRLNDWVPEIRSAAKKYLSNNFENFDKNVLADVLLKILVFWSEWGRIDCDQTSLIKRFIENDEIFCILIRKIISNTSGPMPYILSQLSFSPKIDFCLEEIGTNAIQPKVRAKAMQFLLNHRVISTLKREWKWKDIRYSIGKMEPVISERILSINTNDKKILEYVFADVSPHVRKVGLEFLIKNETYSEFDKFQHFFSKEKSKNNLELISFIRKRCETI